MEIDLAKTGAVDERYYEAMADESRRRVLSALAESEITMSVTELAIELTDGGLESVEPGAGNTDVDRLKIELYHRHLPKLADSGLVDFDPDRRTVSLDAEFADVGDTCELLAA